MFVFIVPRALGTVLLENRFPRYMFLPEVRRVEAVLHKEVHLYICTHCLSPEQGQALQTGRKMCHADLPCMFLGA